MMAKYFATSLAIENVVNAPRVISNCLPISTTSMSLVGSESRSTMLPASRAACVPLCMQTPTSACASAGASLVPSPHMAIRRPLRLFAADVAQLVFGRRLGDEIVDAGFRGDRRRGHRIVAGDHHGLDAHAAQGGEAVPHVRLHHVFQVDHAEDAAAVDQAQRRAARARDLVDRGAERRRLRNVLPSLLARELEHRIDRTFTDFSGSDIDPRHPSRRRELDELGAGRRHLSAHVIFFLRQGDDRAAFRGLVGIAGKQCDFSRLTLGDARHHE